MKTFEFFRITMLLSMLAFLPVAESIAQSPEQDLEPEPTEELAVAEATDTDSAKEESGDNGESAIVADSAPLDDVAEQTETNQGLSISFKTPYSLQDCMDILNTVTEVLIDVGGDLSRVDRESLNFAIDAVADYLQERDDLHSNLLEYKWQEISKHQVQGNSNNTYSFIFNEPELPTGITALSFESQRADSILQKVEVYTPGDELVGPFSKQMRLRHSIPRKYIYHLYQPTEIKKISIKATVYNPDLNKVPQIVIRAGKPQNKEHGKLAIYQLIQAQTQLSGEEPKSILETLVRAREEIARYRMQSRN